MLAAASAWDSLAAELGTAAATYDSVVTGLTSQEWLGPASESAAAAAAPYVAWMADTATQAEHTATSVRAAVGAYETAFSATVPPPLIAANRTQLTELVATNFFGQNSPAIAATEAQYSEMWAQDAAAMYGYAGASANASAVTPFTAPPQTTNPDSQPTQQAATAASTVVPQALQHLSSATASSTLTSAATTTGTTAGVTPATDPLTWLYNQLVGLTGANRTTAGQRTVGDLGYFPLGLSQFNVSIGQQLIPGTPGGAGSGGSSPLAPGGWGPGPSSFGGGGISGGVGQAGTVGRLSVPSTWAAAAPPAGPATGPAAVSTISATSHAAGPNGLLRGIPLSNTGAGRRAAGTFVHKYGFRHTVMPRSPGGG